MNKIIILAVVFSGLAGVGILGNVFLIDIQPLGTFVTLDELPGSICKCANSDGTEFTSAECEQFMEGSDYTDSPEMVCQGLALNGFASIGMAIYGDPPLETQGCNTDFWQSDVDDAGLSSVWPPGYSPNYYFNEMFQVNMKLPDEVDNVIAKNDEKENNGEKVKDETGRDSTSIETVEESLETVEEEVEDSTVTDEVEIDEAGRVIISEPETVEEEVEDSTVTDEVEIDEAGRVIISEPKKGLSLLGALHLKGSQLNGLVRESVAAMLNAAHPEIDYTYSVAEIISMTQIALANEEYDDTITMLKEANGRGNTPICRT